MAQTISDLHTTLPDVGWRWNKRMADITIRSSIGRDYSIRARVRISLSELQTAHATSEVKLLAGSWLLASSTGNKTR